MNRRGFFVAGLTAVGFVAASSLGHLFPTSSAVATAKAAVTPLPNVGAFKPEDRIVQELVKVMESMAMEPNDDYSQRLVKTRISEVLDGFLGDPLNPNHGKIKDYQVICDATNNSPTDLADGKFNVSVALMGKGYGNMYPQIVDLKYAQNGRVLMVEVKKGLSW